MPELEKIIDLYRAAELPRPIEDAERIRKMYHHSNLIITAWDGETLIGIARTITDWSWSSYLADLAVLPDYQKCGVGKGLIERTRKEVGNHSMLLLLSVPTALGYYPKVGFEKENRAFIIHRAQ